MQTRYWIRKYQFSPNISFKFRGGEEEEIGVNISTYRIARSENEKFVWQEADDALLQLAHSSIPDTTYRDERNLNETWNGVRNWCSCKRGVGVLQVETRINPWLATHLICTTFFFFFLSPLVPSFLRRFFAIRFSLHFSFEHPASYHGDGTTKQTAPQSDWYPEKSRCLDERQLRNYFE